MLKNPPNPKLNFNIVHDMAIAFASARMADYKYPDDIGSDELRDHRYANFLTDYAYVISQYQKAIGAPQTTDPKEKALNISVTFFDSILKISADSD